MRRGFSVLAVLLLAALVMFSGCQGEEETEEETKEEETTESLMATMATDVGGLGDQSFNDGAYEGLQRAEEEFGAEIKVVESNQQTDYVPNLTGLAEDGSDIVFAVGFLMEDAVKEAAANMPDTYFGGVDIGANEDDPDNFKGILYKEEQAGYLAGIVAGMMTKEYADRSDKLNDENVVGVVLGMLVPAVEKYEVGYIQGVERVNPDCEVLSVTTGSFDDQAKGKEAGLGMIEEGADIVFHAAGLTGVGTIEAAESEGVFAIGVDVDQNHVAPDTVLTSAEKKIPRSVYLAVKEVHEGNWQGGTSEYGLEDGGVGISDFHEHDEIVPQAVKDEIEKAKEEILSGEVTIETTRDAIGR
ncbi:MAG: BMP family protein [Spirochaetaceae bacterium]